MNGDIEELFREGVDRLAADVQAVDMVARASARVRRRRIATRAALACATAAVTAAAVIAVILPGATPGTGGVMNSRMTAYVINRVQNALTGANFVIQGQTTGSSTPSMSWAYGKRWRIEEFTGSACGQALPNGSCSHRGGSEPYWDEGSAVSGGRLVEAYVTFWDHRYSLSPFYPLHLKACSVTAQLVLGGAQVAIPHWPTFIKAMLGCETATVTGHTRIGDMETIVIKGAADIPLSKGYGKAIREKRVHVRYTLYVDAANYLPVRVVGTLETYGGAARPSLVTSVTDVRWLPPTPANITKALVTIPPGYQQ
jgi:hypothetical protein